MDEHHDRRIGGLENKRAPESEVIGWLGNLVVGSVGADQDVPRLYEA
jgi:hypothetical protein